MTMCFNTLHIPMLQEIPPWRKEISVKLRWTFLMELQMATLGIHSKVSFSSSFLLIDFLPTCQLVFVDPSSCQSLLGGAVPPVASQLMSQKQWGVTDWAMFRYLFSIYLLWARNCAKKDGQNTDPTLKFNRKSHVQMSNCGGSVLE